MHLLVVPVLLWTVSELLAVENESQQPANPNQANANPLRGSKVFLVSLDGFRWDYLQVAARHGVKTPNFEKLLKGGAHSRVRPVYMPITFPSHMSMASGLYPESHGIVAHIMDDKNLGHFNGYKAGMLESDQVLNPQWMDVGAEPIWVTNQKHSSEHKSGVYFWPACGAKFKDQLPSFYERFDKEETAFRKRVDTVIGWFVEKKINLGILYFEEPDHTGHKFGPNSKEIAEVVGLLDGIIGYLIEQLEKNQLLDVVNLIVTSDHGMMEAVDPHEKNVELDKHIQKDWYDTNYLTTVRPIWPKPGKTEQILASLRDVKYMTIYTKETIPEEYHYRDHPRIAPILLEADPGILVLNDLEEFIRNKKKKETITANHNLNKGVHGYTTKHEDMLNIFIARGPAFRQGYTSSKIFENVNVYPLLCHLLGLKPAPNNGSLANVEHLLVTSSEPGDYADADQVQAITTGIHKISFAIWLVVTALVIFGTMCLCSKRRHGNKDNLGCYEQTMSSCQQMVPNFQTRKILFVIMTVTYLLFTYYTLPITY